MNVIYGEESDCDQQSLLATMTPLHTDTCFQEI